MAAAEQFLLELLGHLSLARGRSRGQPRSLCRPGRQCPALPP